MSNRKKGRRVIGVLILFLLIAGLTAVATYLLMMRAVRVEFGQPSKNLSTVQRMVIPAELFIHRRALTEPTSLFGEEQSFAISEGESVAMICIRLEGAGLIPDAELLRMYLLYTGLDRELKAGQFSLGPQTSPVEIVTSLLDATPKDAIITILPGWRIEEVAANVAGSGLTIPAEAFIEAAYHPPQGYFALVSLTDLTSLEGFLFPGTYSLPRESSLDVLLVMTLSEFNTQVDPTLVEGFARQGLTLTDAVKLASIVEREAVLDEEKPLIASVFFNRLEIGMRLETDPTVQYALGFDEATKSWWKSPLSLNDLTINSPFNTYLYDALPPTPICNPDLESLRAVAFPANTPYYYFRAACDESGRHNFAVTFEEHLNNSCD
ncbi:MAG: endolytic transglycosylase MltG [Chloroflexi bacterium]|nr:endolytic transglycosylase MltG [Chloroflexota bacterium]